ncbi:lipase 3 [Drosophila novamexicana]|uniref:lipase 3 n=1 Tax=Drosophila novamexicana TaxID=47314 RepID=UPI0011E5BB1A|nr:lipase 3 [Drosophila novamexicana]
MRVCLVYMIMGCGLHFAFSLDAICRIVQRNRAECEEHRVQTVDGYQLTVQRIPPPRNQSCPTLQPFVLMHGLIGSAADFVAAGRASALAFQLHARCFDVWLPNARGTTESRRHRTLSARQPAFWDFSWHEIGVYDLPAIVEHVLAVTGQRQLHYVGHSQGTTVLLVLLAQRPDFNAWFSSVALLAPIAYLQHLSSLPLRLLASDPAGVTLLLNQLGLHELLPATPLSQVGGQLFCSPALPTYALCTLLTSLYVGFSEYPLDRSIFPRILETTPAGISRGQLLHFGQLINSGKFQQYDYSSARLNSLRYGQATPPTYQLENVRLNLMLFYGNRDALSSRRDVQHLVRELRNSRVKLYQVRGYNHIDFLYATTAPQMIYERIIQQARQIN